MSNAIQLHTDPGASDTLSSSCVPIVLVAGVMGSRFSLDRFGRAWDPDALYTVMSRWYPLLDPISSDVARTRRALSVRETPKATISTELHDDAMVAISVRRRLQAIAAHARGAHTTSIALRDVANYYGEYRRWASVAWSYYGVALLTLEERLNTDPDNIPRNPVFAFGYDWRQSAEASGKELAKFIKNDVLAPLAQTAKDVILITHSMGGLVVRGALKSGGLGNDLVRGVAHAAQPSNGAVTCYRRFISGATPPMDPPEKLNKILGETPATFAYNMSGLPGPLQLLPNQLYQKYFDGASWLEGLDSSYNLGDIYTVYGQMGWPGIKGVVVSAQEQYGNDPKVLAEFNRHLTSAKTFNESIATTFHPKTFALFSTGVSTDHSIAFGPEVFFGAIKAITDDPEPRYAVTGSDTDIRMSDTWNAVTYTRTPAGDGTVAEVSARCPALPLDAPFPRHLPNEPIKHAEVFTRETFNNLVLDCVHKLLCPVWIPNGIDVPDGSDPNGPVPT